MGQHYTLLTVEASAWCPKCWKNTPHRVAARRLQYCLTCYNDPKKRDAIKPEKIVPQDQPKLF